MITIVAVTLQALPESVYQIDADEDFLSGTFSCFKVRTFHSVLISFDCFASKLITIAIDGNLVQQIFYGRQKCVLLLFVVALFIHLVELQVA